MDWHCRLFGLVLVFFVLTVPACSREKSPKKEAAGIKTSTQQAAEAIEEIGKKPIDKAKRAQSLGEDRARAIDEATENIDKR